MPKDGYIQTEEHKEKQRITKLGNKNALGANHRKGKVWVPCLGVLCREELPINKRIFKTNIENKYHRLCPRCTQYAEQILEP